MALVPNNPVPNLMVKAMDCDSGMVVQFLSPIQAAPVTLGRTLHHIVLSPPYTGVIILPCLKGACVELSVHVCEEARDRDYVGTKRDRQKGLP